MSNPRSLLHPAAGSSRLFLDGGFSTELERTYQCHLSAGSLWSAVLLKDPGRGWDCIRNVHLDFLRAGADVIATVRLACDARDEFVSSRGAPAPAPAAGGGRRQPPYVAVSLGSYGAFLADGSEFTGRYPAEATESFLVAFHRARLEAYRRGGALDRADALAFETVPCAPEARAVARLMREEAAAGRVMPFWVSFSATSGAECSSGETVSECFAPFVVTAAAESGGADAVVPGLVALGFNCTNPTLFPSLLRAAAECLRENGAAGKVSLAAYPNLGEEWDPVAKAWRKETGLTAESFGPTVAGWVADLEAAMEGVTVGLVGGCCRTTPEMIASLKACSNSVDGTGR
ncbi:MAG: homocysteine S-methyltransferase [Olpidium bornovanus]|uniref:Homocysteine S-methyltransferase n=1 Tax=Olpidium bornovanus TaxID=278681 RepID=A0A8H8DJJ9_9FUNG|nr:MAG: homocysteine S-methyltransferase [Olpidium bornovanus]